MKSIYSLIIFFLFINFGISQTTELTLFAGSFSNPVELVHANDDRLFVVEQDGVIKILNSDGSVNSTPFLNINSIVGSGGNEQGLLGLAFAPDYTTSGRFYVNYTNNSGDTVIARYTVSANLDVANTNGTILITISQPFSNHNAGKLAFGQDVYLYVATGDGGSGGDPGNRSQDPTTLLGKLLRIDVSGNSYTIPSGNPYENSANGANDPRPEIWAIGLRNPWKMSFDTSNGDLWVADVGQSGYEEINKSIGSGTAGDNYGWRCFEGLHDYNNESTCPQMSNTKMPVSEYAYGNSTNGFRCSITGGYVYRGTTYPNFVGKYFFADYCTGEIGLLTETAGTWTMSWQVPNINWSWTSFGEDNNGEIYVVGGNAVYKISDPNLGTNGFNSNTFTMHPNPASKVVNFGFNSDNHIIKTIVFYDLQGKKIKTIIPSQNRTTSVSIENLPKGFYLVKVTDKNESTLVKKLIIN